MKLLSAIIPMYNEKNIYSNLKEAIKIFDGFTIPYEIIVVDDGSANDCFNEAKKIKSNKVKVVGYKENKGKGNALKYGFNLAKGDYVAFVDADLEINPKQLKNFMKIMEEKNADIVIGSKRVAYSKVHYPFIRRLMSQIYQTLIKILFDLNVKDTQVGLKLFRAEVLRKVFPKILVKRFAFDLEVLVNANHLGYRIVEAPIELNYKFGSTVNLKAIYYILLDTAAIFYRLKILKYYDRK
jgi:glycosyltransferase involved in cell wall biosynthesis